MEELFYSYGDTCKGIGRIETDGKDDNKKRYEKLCNEREHMMKEFNELIKTLKAEKQ
jgi:hypothetical protein